MASHIDPARSAVELRSMHYLRHFGQILFQSLAIYMLLASSSCVRLIICGILGHCCSKGSLFTGFCLTWVGKPRFFTHQMASHIDLPRSAVELRSMHYLRRFGPILFQSLAIYRLLASSSCVRCIFYGVLGKFCSKASLFTCFWPAQVAFDALFTAFWATPAPKPRYLQTFV